MADFDGTDDFFDSRDVIARIAELETEYAIGDAGDFHIGDEDDAEEYEALSDLRGESENYLPDWQYGVTFIADSHFKTYAIELASDLTGDIDPVMADSWPFCYIDWDAAADSLKQDYTEYEFRGTTYWAR